MSDCANKWTGFRIAGRKQKKHIDFVMILFNFIVFIPREDLPLMDILFEWRDLHDFIRLNMKNQWIFPFGASIIE